MPQIAQPTEADARELAAKLTALRDSVPEAQKVLLEGLIAAARGAEVLGFAEAI